MASLTRRVVGLAYASGWDRGYASGCGPRLRVGLGLRLRVGLWPAYASGWDRGYASGCWPRFTRRVGIAVTRRVCWPRLRVGLGSRLRVGWVRGYAFGLWALLTRRLWASLTRFEVARVQVDGWLFRFHITIWYSSGRAARTSRLSFFQAGWSEAPVGQAVQLSSFGLLGHGMTQSHRSLRYSTTASPLSTAAARELLGPIPSR